MWCVMRCMWCVICWVICDAGFVNRFAVKCMMLGMNTRRKQSRLFRRSVELKITREIFINWLTGAHAGFVKRFAVKCMMSYLRSVKCDVWYVALCVNTICRCLIWHLSSDLRKPRPSTALRQEISSVVAITIIQPVLHAICNYQFSLAGIQGVAGPIPGHQSCWRVYRGQCNNAFLGFNDLNK